MSAAPPPRPHPAPPQAPPGRPLLPLAALLGAAAVAAGAFGAHALKVHVTADQLATWNTAVRYHLAHTLVLLVLPVLPAAPRTARLAGWLVLAGIVLFSGSLYALVLTGARPLALLTPIGGTTWIAAWLLLARATWTHRPPPPGPTTPPR